NSGTGRPCPLALYVGILRFVERLRGCHRNQQGRHDHECTDCSSRTHDRTPLGAVPAMHIVPTRYSPWKITNRNTANPKIRLPALAPLTRKPACARTSAHASRVSARPDVKPASSRPKPSVGNDDRVTVLELDLIDVPGTPWSAATQWINLKLDFVARLQSLAGPSVADEAARRASFQAPHLAGAV